MGELVDRLSLVLIFPAASLIIASHVDTVIASSLFLLMAHTRLGE